MSPGSQAAGLGAHRAGGGLPGTGVAHAAVLTGGRALRK